MKRIVKKEIKILQNGLINGNLGLTEQLNFYIQYKLIITKTRIFRRMCNLDHEITRLSCQLLNNKTIKSAYKIDKIIKNLNYLNLLKVTLNNRTLPQITILETPIEILEKIERNKFIYNEIKFLTKLKNNSQRLSNIKKRRLLKINKFECSHCRNIFDLRYMNRNNNYCYPCQRKCRMRSYEKNKSTEISRYIKRRQIDHLFRVKCNLRSRLTTFLKKSTFKKTCNLTEYLGCSKPQLKNHLQKQFTKGMNWNNYGEWHIDHIIPLSSAKNEMELYKLCHYTNLQPLWAIDNIKKGNKC